MSSSRTFALGHLVLGLIALGWTVFLLPRTGFIWWLAGNATYGAISLIAAGLHFSGHRETAWILATGGAAIFIASNATIAIVACSRGGACAQILAVLGVVTMLEVIVLARGQDRR